MVSTKLSLLAVLACVLGPGCTRLVLSGSEPQQALGHVVWVGDASYDASTPAVGMRAGTKRRIVQIGVRVLFDGRSEPLEFVERGSRLQKLTAGDRVRVTYREGAWLFWHEASLVKIEKLAGL
jgi:hypothetical protein